jgi:molybdopterin synthase catalytic subunit
MALAKLRELARDMRSQFPVDCVAVVHRLGRLEIGEASVFIGVSSAHRKAAFDACRYGIDTLKRTVPIWKKEYFADGAVWADGEIPGAPATDSAQVAASKSASAESSS